MALNKAAEKVNQLTPGPSCGFGLILKNLPSDDAEYLDQMVDEGQTGAHIARVFREDGYDVSAFTIRRHLNGECACR